METKTMHTAWLRDGRTVYALSDDPPRQNLWSFNVQSARRGVDCEAVAILAAAAPALAEALRGLMAWVEEARASGIYKAGPTGEMAAARTALKEAGL